MTLLAIFIALVFLHSLVSGRLERTIVTAPIVFTAAGILAFLFFPGMGGRPGGHEAFLRVAEVGLVLLLFSVFFLFGLLVARAGNQFGLTHALYAVLSLTVVRMLPVAVALIGAGLSRATVLFMGWFGPRGLASIVLGLVYLEQQTHQPGESTIRLAVMMTVLLSILAHGLSAMPGIELYARKISTLHPSAPELEGTTDKRAGQNVTAIIQSKH